MQWALKHGGHYLQKTGGGGCRGDGRGRVKCTLWYKGKPSGTVQSESKGAGGRKEGDKGERVEREEYI